MTSIVVIPARWGSSRFPGKPLALLGKKPLIQWAWERAMECKTITKVIVATDDQRIAEVVNKFGGEVVMTQPNHPSGTDRVAEVATLYQADVFVNFQGDEPFLPGKEIDRLIDQMDEAPIATLAREILDPSEKNNPNVVKVVCDLDGFALYFSRSDIPFLKNKNFNYTSRAHVGIYAFCSWALKKFVSLPSGILEQVESLEQLRALENRIPIKVISSSYQTVAIDCPEDLLKAEQKLEQIREQR
ncbi:3-deoxy-manno-octulosonate cytidylyltransferase [Methylacidiphilum caldifontis]|uniref:3-deoxy-manno-octulosonate cytidylyltransferase n=1 Tax=Methylacidiphilum caldifontis TaxID=2795386 RepID=A0A4Y8P9L8_9BACT|nr:3-deoxy-manno-octulosonate cytidylyltransferase [Methylacidiphilum caldifontis]QSR89060.1 3-deoxy-manno-octulosonate cytidylyltransferase [Methylacidiphilum caldifontis]TFE67406.1 3-deoxy-manno-octulosonate cytidylyltransferase [Methylacidiphilum caldifontis]